MILSVKTKLCLVCLGKKVLAPPYLRASLFGVSLTVLLLMGACSSLSKENSSAKDPTKEPKKESATITDPSLKLSGIELKSVNGEDLVTIEATGSIQYTAFKLNNPLRLVLDLSNISSGGVTPPAPIQESTVVKRIKTQFFPQTNTLRLELFLKKAITHKIVRSSTNILDVALKGIEEKKKEPKQEKNQSPKVVIQKAPKIVVSHVDFMKIPDNKYRVLITTSGGKPGFTVIKREDRNHLFLEIEDATTSQQGERELVTSNISSLVKKVISFPLKTTPSRVRVVMEISGPYTYNIYRDKGKILLDFERGVEVQQKPAKKEVITENKNKELPEKEQEEDQKKSAKTEKVANLKIESEDAAAMVDPMKKRVSMDFYEAEVVNILRLIADVSDMNIITSEEVSGKITMRFMDVPWNQALEVILKTANLGMIKEGNIIRVAPISTVVKEKQAVTAAKLAQKADKIADEEMEELLLEIIPVNYAGAADMLVHLEKIKSGRGDLSLDERTNSLIVRDTKKVLTRMKTLVEKLDVRTPQVLIEARIVEVDRNYTKDLGIEWGGSTGVTTRSRFPSAIGLSGSSDGTNVVSLPAAAGVGSGGAITTTFGSVSGLAALDMRLSALETQGNARVLSTPRIVTSDNKTAKIESGRSIPYSTVSSSGTSVQFASAVIKLEVTPHITPDGYIFMKIDATKDEADFSNQVQGTPSIVTKSAVTELLIKDGQTTVIGGLYKNSTTKSGGGVPWISKIPIIGWFFKKSLVSDNGEELMIFVTPTILKI